nr:hypothetical protein CFP56_76568 [Quercus suber]
MLNRPWAKHSGMDPKPIASAGLGPSFGQKGEAWDLGSHYTIVEDLALVRDESVECMSHSRKTHIPIEESDAPAHVTKLVASDMTHPLEATVDLGEDMVTRRALTIDQFLPNSRSASQSQQPLGRDQTPPPPSGHAKKK